MSGSGSGRLLDNLVHFVQLLRYGGVRCGTDATQTAVRALERVGVERRDDVRAALHAVLVSRREHRELFDVAFDHFWRDPLGLEAALHLLAPSAPSAPTPRRRPGSARLDPPSASRPPSRSRDDPPPGDRLEAHMAWAPVESLQTRDFEQMSAQEWQVARRRIAALDFDPAPVRTRRFAPDPRGARIDARATLRAAVRTGGSWIPLRRRARRERPADLVLLCDVSGSMDVYARAVLHFAHGLTRARPGTRTFLFGTRLTPVTRMLRHRDVDAALADIGSTVTDWSGGTRIGAALGAFNRRWSRRVLSSGAVVLLVTDGLDRAGAEGIDDAAARLRRSCRRLIWLNPLLRWDGFEPKASGVRALLHHVDEMRPVHDLASLESLLAALSSPPRRGSPAPRGPEPTSRAPGVSRRRGRGPSA